MLWVEDSNFGQKQWFEFKNIVNIDLFLTKVITELNYIQYILK